MGALIVIIVNQVTFFNNCNLRKKRTDYLMKVQEVIFNSCLNKKNRRVCYSRLIDCSNSNTICISLTNSWNGLLCIRSCTSSSVSFSDSIHHISFSVLNSLSQYLFSICIILLLQRLNILYRSDGHLYRTMNNLYSNHLNKIHAWSM